MERPATTAAAIAGARGAEIASDGEEDVGQEEGIAQVVEGGDAEDDIADGTDAHEAEGIEEGIGRLELAPHIVEGGHGDDEHGPD